MFMIFYFIFWLQSSTTSSSSTLVNPNKPYVVEDMATYLNEIKKFKNLTSLQNKLYDELIEKFQQFDSYHENFVSKITSFHQFLNEECDLELSSSAGCKKLNMPDFEHLFWKQMAEIKICADKEATAICEITNIIPKTTLNTIFSNDEKETMKDYLNKGENFLKEACSDLEKDYKRIIARKKLAEFSLSRF